MEIQLEVRLDVDQLTKYAFLFLVPICPHQDLMLGEMIPLPLSELFDHGGQKEATRSRNLSRYALIFLLLALSGLIFLLRNIHSVEVRDQSCFLLKTSKTQTLVMSLFSELELSHCIDHPPAPEQNPVVTYF